MLHRLNPVRLGFIREAIDAHWGGDARERQAARRQDARSMSAAARGCCASRSRGWARRSPGVDAAAENIEAARAPCRRLGPGDRLPRTASSAALGLGTFDLVTCDGSDRACRRQARVRRRRWRDALAPGGLMVLSTPNRTPQSRLLLVGAAEALGAIPRGTHHWDDFVTPDELRDAARRRRAGDGRAARHRLVAAAGPAPVERPVARTTSSPRPASD